MSSTETQTPPGDEVLFAAAEYEKSNGYSNMLVREFKAEITPGEGRTIDVRIVPYGERIEHNDGLGGVRRGVTYREEFIPGVFNHQLNAAFRVHANVEHEQGINGKVGHGVALHDSADGFHGSFVLLETNAGETALQLLRVGALDGVSMEAEPVKSTRTRDGVVQRVKANLRGIAFTRFGAYKGAKVLAVREEPELLLDEEIMPVEMDDGLIERCRRLGLKLPQRYEAHPEETGTPDLSGTPVVGTRQPGDHHELEGTGDADTG